MNLRGLGVALVTPFNTNKEIDYDSLASMVDYVIAGNADYIVVLGTTGETPTLSEEEKTIVRRFIVEKVCGKVPLVMGLGGNCTHQLLKDLETINFEGYSAILSVTPFYNKPSQDGMYIHYTEIAHHSPLPVVLYNVPGRTGVNLEATTTLKLALENENIIGIKEASGKFKQIEEIITGKPDGFQVISGDDALTYPLMTMGAEGVISVVGNAFPKEFGKMVRLCLNGEYGKALPIHHRFSKLYDLLFKDGNPAGVKSLLHDMGLIENELRLPLVPTCIETSEEMRVLMRQLREG